MPEALPDPAAPGRAYPNWGPPEGLDPALVVRLEKIYLKPRRLEKLAEQAGAGRAGACGQLFRPAAH